MHVLLQPLPLGQLLYLFVWNKIFQAVCLLELYGLLRCKFMDTVQAVSAVLINRPLQNVCQCRKHKVKK